jgi:hypothetical protein
MSPPPSPSATLSQTDGEIFESPLPKVELEASLRYDTGEAVIRLTNKDVRASFRIQVQQLGGLYDLLARTSPSTPYDLPWEETGASTYGEWKQLLKGETAVLKFAKVRKPNPYANAIRGATEELPSNDPFAQALRLAQQPGTEVLFWRYGSAEPHVASSSTHEFQMPVSLAVFISGSNVSEDVVQKRLLLEVGTIDHFTVTS